MKGPALIVAALAVAFISPAPSAEAGFLKNFVKVAKVSKKFNAAMLRAAPKIARDGNLRLMADHSKKVNKLFLNCALNPNYDDPEASWTCPK